MWTIALIKITGQWVHGAFISLSSIIHDFLSFFMLFSFAEVLTDLSNFDRFKVVSPFVLQNAST